MSQAGNKRREAMDEQMELALKSVAPHALFPGRQNLYPQEVADALEISKDQVFDLIEEGVLFAIEVASPKTKSGRSHWRIPVSEFDRYCRTRNSFKQQ